MPSIDYSKQAVKFNVKIADGVIDSVNGTTDKTITINGLSFSEEQEAEDVINFFGTEGLNILHVADGEKLTLAAETTTNYSGGGN